MKERLASLAAIGLGRSRPAVSRCEVVCFGPRRTGSWADRTAALSALPGVQQVYAFENRGKEIGVTLHHPHGQIYAYPYVTPRTRGLLAWIASYGADLMGDILAFERKSERLVIAGEHCTVFAPFAARWPVEGTCCRTGTFPTSRPPPERDEIAALYRRILRAVDRLYGTPTPYIAAWHQGTRVPRARRDTADAAGDLSAPDRGQAEIPGWLRGRDRRVHRRCRARGRRQAAAGPRRPGLIPRSNLGIDGAPMRAHSRRKHRFLLLRTEA